MWQSQCNPVHQWHQCSIEVVPNVLNGSHRHRLCQASGKGPPTKPRPAREVESGQRDRLPETMCKRFTPITNYGSPIENWAFPFTTSLRISPRISTAKPRTTSLLAFTLTQTSGQLSKAPEPVEQGIPHPFNVTNTSELSAGRLSTFFQRTAIFVTFEWELATSCAFPQLPTLAPWTVQLDLLEISPAQGQRWSHGWNVPPDGNLAARALKNIQESCFTPNWHGCYSKWSVYLWCNQPIREFDPLPCHLSLHRIFGRPAAARRFEWTAQEWMPGGRRELRSRRPRAAWKSPERQNHEAGGLIETSWVKPWPYSFATHPQKYGRYPPHL